MFMVLLDYSFNLHDGTKVEVHLMGDQIWERYAKARFKSPYDNQMHVLKIYLGTREEGKSRKKIVCGVVNALSLQSLETKTKKRNRMFDALPKNKYLNKWRRR